ncbi:MAG: hypothetical protein CM1200mP10_22610 [Candidatus Neomarinimicrobiota bacterium]|nr:MAG: hypothetical protein CM1200mP10_22610 [Candidatus Neomarinimicrobiota bacterium]
MDSLVSFIIPHWNGIDVLSKCLDSLKQTVYPNFEIIVVDNASTDGSGDWIKDHHPQIKLIKMIRIMGIPVAVIVDTSSRW